MADKKKPMILRHVPDDVRKILLKNQGVFKAQCNCQFSLPSTIFKIVRSWEVTKDYRVGGVTVNQMADEILNSQ